MCASAPFEPMRAWRFFTKTVKMFAFSEKDLFRNINLRYTDFVSPYIRSFEKEYACDGLCKHVDNDLLTVPFAPLGLIAMPGCEELGQKVNNWLMKWYEQQEALEDTPLFSLMGCQPARFLD